MIAVLDRCWRMVPTRLRARWALLIPLVFVAAGLEALGATGVYLLIDRIGRPDAVGVPIPAPLPSFAARIATLPTGTLAIGLAVFYAAKNSFLACLVWLEYRLAGESAAEVARHVFRGYLEAPYEETLRRSFAEMARTLGESVGSVFRMVLLSAVTVASELLVLSAIAAVLIAAAPWSASSALAVLALALALLLRGSQRIVHGWGQRTQELHRTILQSLQHGLGALKEVKVAGAETYFVDEFAHRYGELSRLQSLHAASSATPRLLIESVFLGGILFVVVLLARQGRAADPMPLLGLYAYAGFRLIPSANRILMCMNNVHYGAAAVEHAWADFERAVLVTGAGSRGSPGEPSRHDRIELRDVSYRYPGAATDALHDVSLTIRRGESLGIVGMTGAGKTTLLHVLVGLLGPTRGAVVVDGRDLQTMLADWQSGVGYVPQSFTLIHDSLRRNVAFGIRDVEVDEERLAEATRGAQLEDVVASLPGGLDAIVGESGVRLSGGEQQRVAIARALYRRPAVLVLDEATSALDPRTEHEIVEATASLRGRATRIIAAHRWSTVRSCDRLLVLRGGRVVACGSYDELVERSSEFRALASLAGGAPARAQ